MTTYTQREIEELRKKLLNYYGTATAFMPFAAVDLVRVEQMSADEIIREARKVGLI